jgi:uncharacterized protein YndB with AHSA1/START domain
VEEKVMADKVFQLTFSQVVDAPPEDACYAFATAQGWRDWMCDSARFEPRPGGNYQFSWNSGWFTAGSVKEILRPERIVLTWRGKDDPGYTEVTIVLKAEGNGSRVEIQHSGFGHGEAWDRVREESQKGWETALENLEAIFDTGIDLRIARRPMLGVFLSDFNEKIAKELGVPVTKGVRIDRPVPGMGAERAGLLSSDVIVEMDGKAILGYADLGAVLTRKQAGDVVPVSVYRGSDRTTLQMELSGRQFEDFTLDPTVMADRINASNKAVMKDLRQLMEGVSEEEAGHRPAPEEWSAKETLAHLIDSEGYTLDYISELLNDGQREFSGDGGDSRPRLQALLDVTPTIPELLDRLEKSKREVVSLLSRAEKLKARKGVLWRLALGSLEYPDIHERTHMEQITATIEAARRG